MVEKSFGRKNRWPKTFGGIYLWHKKLAEKNHWPKKSGPKNWSKNLWRKKHSAQKMKSFLGP